MSQTTIRAADLRSRIQGSNRVHEYLVAAVLEYCALHSIPARAIHTGPRVAPRAGGGFDLRTNKRQWGISDVIACVPPHGRLALIECKTGGAKRSREQREVRDEFTAVGALCLEVRDIRDLTVLLPSGRATREGSRT